MGLRTSKNRRRASAAERVARVQGVLAGLVMALFQLLCLAGIAGGLYFGVTYARRWATPTPELALQTVQFSGLERARGADLERMGGLQRGQNLLLLDPRAVEKALGGHPWIARVQVGRHFPHGLSVQVQEHRPRAFVALGELYVLNDEGAPFKQLQADDALDLPLITGVDRDAYLESPEPWGDRFRAALDVIDAYDRRGASRAVRLSELRLEQDGFVLVTGAGEEISLGEGSVDQKLARLERVRRELSVRGLRAERIRLDNRARPGWVAVQLGDLTP